MNRRSFVGRLVAAVTALVGSFRNVRDDFTIFTGHDPDRKHFAVYQFGKKLRYCKLVDLRKQEAKVLHQLSPGEAAKIPFIPSSGYAGPRRSSLRRDGTAFLIDGDEVATTIVRGGLSVRDKRTGVWYTGT